MPSKKDRPRSHGHAVCGLIYEKTGQRCTKKPGHSGTRHSNEKPGYEVSWEAEDARAA